MKQERFYTYLDLMIVLLQVISDALRLFVFFREIHVLVIMPLEQDIPANGQIDNKTDIKNV